MSDQALRRPDGDATGGASTDVNQATAALEGRYRVIYGGIIAGRAVLRLRKRRAVLIHGFDHVAVDHESRSTNRGLMCSVSISAHLCSAASLCRYAYFATGQKQGPATASPSGGEETAGRQVKATEPDAMHTPSSEIRGATEFHQ